MMRRRVGARHEFGDGLPDAAGKGRGRDPPRLIRVLLMEREREQREAGGSYGAHRAEDSASTGVLGEKPCRLRGYDEDGEVVGRQSEARHDCPPRKLATAGGTPCQLERQHR
jgi:hypothetical protein